MVDFLCTSNVFTRPCTLALFFQVTLSKPRPQSRKPYVFLNSNMFLIHYKYNCKIIQVVTPLYVLLYKLSSYYGGIN